MAGARKRVRQRRRAKSLIGSMREFLTPAVFKQARNASKRRKFPRWDLHPPGESFSGFEKAVAKLPMPMLRALATGIRGRVEAVFGDRWTVGNFIPFG